MLLAGFSNANLLLHLHLLSAHSPVFIYHTERGSHQKMLNCRWTQLTRFIIQMFWGFGPSSLSVHCPSDLPVPRGRSLPPATTFKQQADKGFGALQSASLDFHFILLMFLFLPLVL